MSNYGTIFELSNERQKEFIRAINTLAPEGYRYYFYGGAIRGGKTFVVLFLLHYLSLIYPGSVWVVVREHLPALKQTTIPSFLKLLGDYANTHGKMNYSSHEYQYSNGSKIIFKAENLKADKNLDSFLGLECNGFFLEQIEEQSEKMFEMAKQRAGSLYIPNMPNAYIFSTFNPTNRWVKKVIYDKWKLGELSKPYYYLNASPKDNPHVTKDQWDAWETLDPRTYAQMIEGDWAITELNDNRFIYSFDNDRHVSKETLLANISPFIYLCLDFNVATQVALIAQTDTHNRCIRILREYFIRDCGIDDLCIRVKRDYPKHSILVVGDASGWSRDKMVAGFTSHYSIVMKTLGIGKNSIKNPKGKANPTHQLSRGITNSIMDKHPDLLIDPSCEHFIEDLKVIDADDKGSIKKVTGDRSHLLDAYRYFIYWICRKWLKIK